MRATLAVIYLLGLVALSLQRSTPEDAHYIAAVLEYNPDSDISANLRNYVDFIQQAAAQNADIVIFPEMTLTRGSAVVVPFHGLLKDFPTPALRPDLYDDVLVQLSQAALDGQIYVVANVQEEMDCSSAPGELCPSPQRYRFNTNVVFDRSGKVTDRYRKINLFGEASRTPALQDELGVFSTDFGVTFGHFICFDLMFQVPAIQVVQKYNITDVVFTTMWFSEMPFLTAVEIQEAYAYSNNVNFLASGASNVRVGSAGSGIYSGKAGALISTMPGVNTRKLLVSKVPKVPGNVEGISYPGALPNDPKVQDNLFLKRDLSLPSHVTRVIQETEDEQQFVLEDGDVSCSFKIQLRDLQQAGDQVYEYRATAFDGVRTFDWLASGGLRVCSIVACSGPQVETCSVRFAEYSSPSFRRFSQLSIEARVPAPALVSELAARDAAYFATSLDSAILPLPPSQYYYSERYEDGSKLMEMELLNAEAELLVFGVWGRLFVRDGEEPTPPLQEYATGGAASVMRRW